MSAAATISADVEVMAALERADETATALVELMEQLRDLPRDEQHDALVEWARSPFWGAMLMIMEGWQGKLARAAYRALQRELEADTPGRRWDRCDHMTGRASIKRLLGLGDDPAAAYAAIPFRTWVDDDQRTWIAAAIGAPPIVDLDRAARWLHLDIRDVILWDPRTNEARTAGEHHSANLIVMPDQPETRLSVWGDCGAFFRAWAARRTRTGKLAAMRARGEWSHPINEPVDGDMPGALVIGNAMRAAWPRIDATSITAQAGVTRVELHAAAFRAARFPAFEGA